MGGFGSGKVRRRGNLYHSKEINIRYLKKNGYLSSNQPQVLGWRRDGKITGSVCVSFTENQIQIDWKQKEGDQEWEDKQASISIEKTACRFGGTQPWFICPTCHRKVINLYLHSKGQWSCRQCADLFYPSENESKLDRQRRKVDRLKSKLREDYWIKPKGMHQKTFDRLLNQYLDAETQYHRLTKEAIEKLVSRF